MRSFSTFLIAAAMFLQPFVVAAETIDEGRAAFRQGDFKRAESIFKSLAEKGSSQALSWYAETRAFDMISTGTDARVALLASMPFFSMCADSGVANCQTRMCRLTMPRSWERSPDDPSVAKALSWCMLSSASGDQMATKNLRFYKRRLPERVVNDAEQLSLEFEPQPFSGKF